ncbi:DUF5711 family protein [Clostridium sp. AN503]|uniref:DUF5711 family protein n=1 Tax=Clostridium sp. AN503 TaxID=3160598 RepID=UPI003458A0EE
MSDMSSMNRESKKRQLRRQMVSSDTPVSRPGVRSEDSEEAVRRAHKKVQRRRLIIVLAVLILVGGGAGAWFYYQRTYQYTSFETAWQIDINEGSLVGYETFGNNVLKYTKDGASYIDNRGKNIWTESYEMKTPIAAVQGDYAAIADKQGNSIYICSLEGKVGQATTVLPISKVAVSGTGIVAAVLEDSVSSYITFFNKDGSKLDILVKTKMSGDGYPLDIALSQDGTQLMCSFIYQQGSEVNNRVVFYDFSEVGKNIPNRLVGGFDEQFKDTMVPRVTYMGEPYSCAFSGSGLTFFSSKNLASPELVVQIPIEEGIDSVFYSEDYAAAIVKNNSGEYASRLEVYKKDGTHVLSKEFSYEYTHADIDGDLIILYNEDSCEIFNMAGVQKLYATFDYPISKIRRGRFPDTLVVTGPQQMREIKLH